MDSYQYTDQPQDNLLPYDGFVRYYGPILSDQLATEYYSALLEKIHWQHDRAKIFGKEITTKRKVAWYADQAFSYTYSKVTKTAYPWTFELFNLKQLVESVSGSAL